jgi:hypothetical protein
MKNLILSTVLLCSVQAVSLAQDFGLSFSYFVPRHGYMSTPISPFSIRGIGKDINRYLAIETGASLYRMSGLAMKDLPLNNNAPFIGPNYTIFVPVELVVQLKGNGVEFDIKGGGFFFYGFDQKLNYGNIDKAVRELEGWQIANSDFTFKNKPGVGYHAGAELTINVTQQVAVSLESNYLVGQSKFPLRGNYTGYDENSNSLDTKQVDYKDAKIDFTGFEFSVGLIFSSGGGQGPKAKARRRRR